MADFDGAPFSGSNCHLMGSKSHPQFFVDAAAFSMSLKLYALKIDK